MDMPWEVAENGEDDIDEKIPSTACYEQDAQGWKKDGDDYDTDQLE